MKHRIEGPTGVQELCRKLKIQLDELSNVREPDPALPREEKARRNQLMEQLKRQLADLSR